MSLKYLNLTGLSRVITNLKNWVVSQIPTKTSEITNDSGFINNTDNCVHTTGAETVGGEKTFTSNPVFKGNITCYWDRGGTLGTNPSSTMYYQPLQTRDTNNDVYFLQRGYITTSGTNAYTWYVYNWGDNSKSAYTRLEMSLAGTSSFKTSVDNLIPVTNDVTNLGISGLRWKSVYSNSYYLGTTAFGDIVTHNASEFLTSHQTVSNSAPTLAWGTTSTIGTIGGTALTVKMPANPNTNTTYSAGTGLSLSGTTFSLALTKALVTDALGYTPPTQDTVYTHPTSAGNKHIPSGGSANQYLKYSASGTAVWADLPTIPTKTSQLTNDSGFLTSHQSLAGYLPLTGGVLTGGVSRKHTGVTKGTNPDSVCYWSVYNCDKDGTNYKNDCLGLFETSLDTAGVVSTYIRAMKNTANNNSNASLGVAYDTANNLGYTFAPTPAANDNTTKIATTAWVQTFCGTTKGYLTSHQSLSNYSTLAHTVKSLSISGKTITVTPGSGNAYTLTTQDTVYTHPTTAGNKHIPSGGSSGQILKYSSSGTAVWADPAFSRGLSEIAKRTTTGAWNIPVTAHSILYLWFKVKFSASVGGNIEINGSQGSVMALNEYLYVRTVFTSGAQFWGDGIHANVIVTWGGTTTAKTAQFGVLVITKNVSSVTLTTTITSGIESLEITAWN